MAKKKNSEKTIKSALISVYHKAPAQKLIETLHRQNIKLISTGGTLNFIKGLGIPVTPVEEYTGYPSLFGGRVKTLHPAIFGGILARRGVKKHQEEMEEFSIAPVDMVVVDLYPFEETLASHASHEDIIEKIDIGGISLIRAAAKNYEDVLVVPSVAHFEEALALISLKGSQTALEDRRRFAAAAFDVSSHYDSAIFHYLNKEEEDNGFKCSIPESRPLRYGENPHQEANFYGNLEDMFEQLGGKELSYNNLLDIDAAINLMADLEGPSFAIFKHTNPCGVASKSSLEAAWKAALSGDPVSAFGGILISNRNITRKISYAINELFFEVLIAPGFDEQALDILSQKKKRILLKSKPFEKSESRFRSALNGVLWQTPDEKVVKAGQWKVVTKNHPDEKQVHDLAFANTVVKHLKSNAIALIKNKQVIGTGMGQTSRVDALKQAVLKAKSFKHSLEGAVMASDAFFPFADCVEIAHKEGIKAVIQPGGSVKDQDSIAYCDKNGLVMVFTGIRHFKH